MNTETNTTLWDAVTKTDPKYAKPCSQRGGFTAISPGYQASIATKQFGPYGLGWGLAESNFDYGQLEATGMVIHNAVFFYVLKGERITFPIHNAIRPTMGYGDKQKADEDFAKKMETNTISKALSRLGFNADVFMGMYDERDYVDGLRTEFGLAEADDADEELKSKREEFSQWCKSELATYPLIPNAAALRTVLTGHFKKINRQAPLLGMDTHKIGAAFQVAYDEAIEVLKKGITENAG